MVQALIDDELLQRLERELLAAVQSDTAEITAAGATLIKAGGKRLRPTLLLLAAQCGERCDLDRAMPLAVSVELIHMASLVHDDVIDRADTRRGTATTNAKWGNRLAILLGDYLFSRAFLLTLGHGYDERLASRMAEIVRNLATGEIRQDASLFAPCAEDEYLTRIALKTGNFFGLCCELGALLSEAGQPLTSALRDYGRAFGMAFQLTDDLLDLTADGTTLGKPAAGNDLRQGVLTLPVLRALSTSDRRGELLAIAQTRAAAPAQIARAVAIVRESDGLAYTRRLAADYADRALAALAVPMPDGARSALTELARFVLQRRA